MAKSVFLACLDKHQAAIETVRKSLLEDILACAQTISRTLMQGHKVLFMGNVVQRRMPSIFLRNWSADSTWSARGLPVIALTTDISILTAVGNNYGFDQVFSFQTEALALPGDVVIGLSTSGNSENVLHALNTVRRLECVTIGR